jgi:hypothetical protein
MNGKEIKMSNDSLIWVEKKDEVKSLIKKFNNTAGKNKKIVEKIIRQNTYWVYWKKTNLFAPPKFIAFKDMNFDKYEEQLEFERKLKCERKLNPGKTIKGEQDSKFVTF